MRSPLVVLLLLGACSAPARRLAPAPAAIASAPSAPAVLRDARQLVRVLTPSWTAPTGSLQRFSRASESDRWLPVGAPIAVVVGRSGLGWGDETAAEKGEPVKREGDGRAPAGAFPLDTLFGFAPAAEISWARLPYVSLRETSDCVDDVRSAHYNTVVDRDRVARVDWSSAEPMRQIAQYRLGAIVGYNAAPPIRGRGSCIFLHIWGGPASATAGCTAMDSTALETVLRWLDVRARPAVVQLTAGAYARHARAWDLPAR